MTPCEMHAGLRIRPSYYCLLQSELVIEVLIKMVHGNAMIYL